MDSTKRSLLDNVRDGDERAWRIFVETYTPLILKYARIRGLRDEEADEIAQTVFVQLAKSMERFQYDPAKGRFRGYLRTAVDREIRRHFDRNRKRSATAVPAEELERAPATNPWSRQWQIAIFRAALERLQARVPERDWRVFKSAWLGNIPPTQIAEAEGESTQWVAKVKFRLQQILKREVDLLSDDSLFL